jgi:hypothetical protein
MSKRETLYTASSSAIAAGCRRRADAHAREARDLCCPATLLNWIWLSAMRGVSTEGERLLRRITDQYFSNNLTLENVRSIVRSDDADPLLAFGEACRSELRSMRARA